MRPVTISSIRSGNVSAERGDPVRGINRGAGTAEGTRFRPVIRPHKIPEYSAALLRFPLPLQLVSTAPDGPKHPKDKVSARRGHQKGAATLTPLTEEEGFVSTFQP